MFLDRNEAFSSQLTESRRLETALRRGMKDYKFGLNSETTYEGEIPRGGNAVAPNCSRDTLYFA